MGTAQRGKELKAIIILLTLSVFKTKVFTENILTFFKKVNYESSFYAHEPSDTVGVVVVEKVKAGQGVTGWIMETDKMKN
ncbi:MAG: hypothetical protein Ct9H300mP28_38020 [Pseudomonadota bacterium]|nr:MAG: hypothetical protein Ct9H300mP28_38020 [Pseudomonadota bacterium]